MKRLLLFCLMLICVGCNRDRDSATTNNTGNSRRKIVAEQLDGYWLSESYLLDVDSSRSTYHSRDYSTKLWGFRLVKENLLSDSAVLNGFTLHEGGYGGPITFDSVKGAFINDMTKADQFSFLDKPYELRLIDGGLLEFDFGHKKDRYRKVSDEQTELRKLLFEGAFNDLIHDDKVIRFSSDGRIIGLERQNYFEVVFDFGDGIDYDAVILYPDQESSGMWKKGDLFHFRINADTLKLYRIMPDWDEMNHTIGDLEYVLVRRGA
jgi:hypothetical protein